MNIARYIDHTLLKPDATEKQINQLCREAKEYGFAAVCVNPMWVRYCSEKLVETPVKVCTVVGFPLGANLTRIKVDEASTAMRQGATEIDMVLNVGALKSGDIELVQTDIGAVRWAIPKVTLKVIIEVCLLDKADKEIACCLAQLMGADFVKTSTGFSSSGATYADVALMRRVVGPEMGVKASGGIKTLIIARSMIDSGANRLGCSNSVAIVQEEQALEKA